MESGRNNLLAQIIVAFERRISRQLPDTGRLQTYCLILDRYRAFLPLLETELRTRWGVEIEDGVAP